MELARDAAVIVVGDPNTEVQELVCVGGGETLVQVREAFGRRRRIRERSGDFWRKWLCSALFGGHPAPVELDDPGHLLDRLALQLPAADEDGVASAGRGIMDVNAGYLSVEDGGFRKGMPIGFMGFDRPGAFHHVISTIFGGGGRLSARNENDERQDLNRFHERCSFRRALLFTPR